LSQSAVNDKAGARTPLALIFASLALALSLLFLTDSLENLPKAVLAAIVFTAVLGLIDIRALSRMWRIKSSTSCSRSVA
jgi:MFS superfamily sulfate permease-like transporter